MRRFGIGLLVALFSFTGLYASMFRTCWSEPCRDPCPFRCCGSVEVGGQWIYLRPTSCDYDFAIKDPRPFDATTVDSTNDTAAVIVLSNLLPEGKSHGSDPDYASGFRVSVGYIMDFSCVDIRVEYTYHHPTNSSQVFGIPTGCNLWPTYQHPRYTRNTPGATAADISVFNPVATGMQENSGDFLQGVAHSNVKLDYDAVDLQFGSRPMKSCNLWMRTYAGLHFMNLDHRHTANYFGGYMENEGGNALIGVYDTTVRWTKNTWGVGPLFGLNARYHVACGFGMGGHLGAAILAGETNGRMTEVEIRTPESGNPSVNETLGVRHDHRNLIFPYLRVGFGVNYLFCRSCLRVLLEVGYEFNSYINTIGHFRFNDERGTGTANCYSYNLDGIYAGIRATI